MTRSIYRRLTGKARSLGGYSQLWIAEDHILLVRSTHFSERYQRFALADIQAVVITEEPSRTPLQAALGAIALLWMLASLAVSSAFAKGFFLVTGGVALSLAVVDAMRGPRCRCYLHTAVSRELLPPVRRMHGARAFLAKLQPAVEAVQGALATEQIPAIEDRTLSSVPGVTAAAPDQPPEIAPAPGYLAETVFGVLLINAAMILASGLLHQGAQLITNALLTTLFGELVIVVVALIRRGRDPRRFIYPLMLIALVGMGWDLVVMVRHFGGYLSSMMAAAQRGANPPVIGFWSAFDRSHALIAAAWRLVVGALGLAAALWERQQSSPKPVQVVTP
jgi:hypothetical protein